MKQKIAGIIFLIIFLNESVNSMVIISKPQPEKDRNLLELTSTLQTEQDYQKQACKLKSPAKTEQLSERPFAKRGFGKHLFEHAKRVLQRR